MKNKLKLWLLAACLLTWAGCGDECDDPEPLERRQPSPILHLDFFTRVDSLTPLYAEDTVYDGYFLDSLFVEGLDGSELHYLSYGLDSTGISFWFLPLKGTSLGPDDPLVGKEIDLSYSVYFKKKDVDTISVSFCLEPYTGSCNRKGIQYKAFESAINDSVVTTLEDDPYLGSVYTFIK